MNSLLTCLLGWALSGIVLTDTVPPSAVSSNTTAEKKIKILPLGNSITNGTDKFNSYRRDLWKLLAKAGLNVDFIGSWNKHHMGGEVPDSDFDMDHEGHSGWTVANMFSPPSWDSARGNIYQWLTRYTPDIVLVELGTNDVFQCRKPADIIEDMQKLIAVLRANNPSVKIFIAQIPPLGIKWRDKNLCGNNYTYDSTIKVLNGMIASLCRSAGKSESPVVAVDQYSGIDPAVNMYDDIHPNAIGEAVMAKRWFDAIYKWLPGHNPRNYYISNRGSDDNDGSRETPWATIAQLNNVQLNAGDSVFFKGGQVFTGSLLLNGIQARAEQPVVITSYGTGKAVIHSSDTLAISLSESQFVYISRLALAGSGRKTGNTSDGLAVVNSRHIRLDSLTVRGYQHAGLGIYSSSYVHVSHVHAFENGYAGISVQGEYGSKEKSRHIYIEYCTAENNPGSPAILNNHSGSGIVAGCSTGVLIEYCTATNNGWDMPRKGNGPVGIWAYECDSVVIQHCISYRNRTSKGGDDGGGFDLDGGVTNSVIQYCLSYENEGSGFGLFQYAGASEWSNNTVRYNVSENDGAVSAAQAGVYIWNSTGDPGQFKNCFFHNNVIYNQNAASIHFSSESRRGGFRFYNNLFTGKEEIIYGDETGDTFSANNFRSIRNKFNINGETKFTRWNKKNGNANFNLNPALKKSGTTTLTDPSELRGFSGYQLPAGSMLRNKGVGLKSPFGITDSVPYTIKGELKYDTDGNIINAHGGGFLYDRGKYYWFGEIKKGKTWEVPGQDWECYRVPPLRASPLMIWIPAV